MKLRLMQAVRLYPSIKHGRGPSRITPGQIDDFGAEHGFGREALDQLAPGDIAIFSGTCDQGDGQYERIASA